MNEIANGRSSFERVIRNTILVIVLFAVQALAGESALLRTYVESFNAGDEELYTNTFSNAQAFDFLSKNIPLFECPDKDIERTYYFRWWTFRKHVRKTPDGWVVTEFLPNVSWAGKHNTIACPLGHHLREGRWLRDASILEDYIRFMVTQGTLNGPRAYACWPAWGTVECAKVTGNESLARELLPAFVANYSLWEKGWKMREGQMSGLRSDRGLFDYAGENEGTEFALSVNGARPMVNAAMWAEASAIAHVAEQAGEKETARRFTMRAEGLADAIRRRLWNKERKFFTTLGFDGALDGVCELHGYAPFYFRLPLSSDYLSAWDGLLDEHGFYAPVGLTFPRRDTPGFDVTINYSKHECLWNGPSWPYATSLALTALYETLQAGETPEKATAADFARLVKQYARQHVLVRADGTRVPWIDENLHPFTGVWIARDVLNEWTRRDGGARRRRERGKDYNHSTFCNLVIAGLCGVVPQNGQGLAVRPLAPREWDWFRLTGVRYHGHDLSVTWDRTGEKYRKGAGLIVEIDGVERARGKDMSGPLVVLYYPYE